MTSFHEFLRDRIETSGFSTEDTLASFLPLVRETLEAHAAGRVAPLVGLDALQVAGVRIWFEDALRAVPRDAESDLRRLQAEVGYWRAHAARKSLRQKLRRLRTKAGRAVGELILYKQAPAENRRAS